jgi:hypothetical protein
LRNPVFASMMLIALLRENVPDFRFSRIMSLTHRQVISLKIALWLLAGLCAVAVLIAWGSSSNYPRIPCIRLPGWLGIIGAISSGLGGLACHLYMLDPPPEE